MPPNVTQLRKLVAMDEDDPLSRFALGQALFQEDENSETLNEAAEHLFFANAKDPDHLATYHVLGQVLIRSGRSDEARSVLEAGCAKTGGAGLGPAMAKLLETL